MILPILVDTASMMDQFTSLTPQVVEQMLDNVAKGLTAGYAQTLEQLAAKELHQTRASYMRNIKVIDSGKMEGTVMLDYSKDPLVKMIEEGADSWDMKEAFLKSAKVKIGKNGGRYLTIPFRWATPGAVGDSDVFSGIMPKEVYKIVKNKPLEVYTAGGGVRTTGLSLKELPTAFQVKQKRAAIVDNKGNELFKEYEHKYPLHQGIVKQNDPETGQNTYHSFRRVSDASDPEAWIHPGIQAYHLMSKAMTEFNVETELGLQIDNELAKLGLI